jgi:mono/diheme cytochrome c family protein
MRSAPLFAVIALAAALPLAAAHAEVDKKTEHLWKSKCSSCHGVDGKGATDQGQKMGIADYTKPEWQKSRTDAQLKTAINEGVNVTKDGKKQEMDPYKDKITAEQVNDLVGFIRALK